MKRNKSGISLIVLVITVIVMIILAGSVIISLSNSGIIGKANEAVDANNLKQVQQIAALAWSDAYIDKMADPTVDLKVRVEEALTKNKVDTSKYVVNVTDTGVEVRKPSLGDLIKTAADYGKTVDYTVTVDGKTYDKWQVFYEDEKNGYVFLASKENVGNVNLGSGDVSVADLSEDQLKLYDIFKLGQAGVELSDDYPHHKSIAQLIAQYEKYANKNDYGTNVIGAIGAPTIELLSAGWNAKEYSPSLNINYYFPYVNGESERINLNQDGLYLVDYPYWLAAPSTETGLDYFIIFAATNYVHLAHYAGTCGARPVVCLKSTIPAIETETGYSLIK